MRIGLLSLNFNPVTGGGSHHSIAFMIKCLSERGHDVSLFTVFSNNNIPPETKFRVIENDFNGPFLDLQKKVADLLREHENDFDIYIFVGPPMLWGGGMYKNQGGRAKVITFLNNYTEGMGEHQADLQGLPFAKKIKPTIQARLFRYKRFFWEKCVGMKHVRGLDSIIATSPALRAVYESFGYPKEKMATMPDWVDADALHRDVAGTLEHNADTFHLLHAGRLMYDKGADILIAAIPDVLKKHNVSLTIVGDGPQKKYLQKMIADLQIEKKVRLQGWMPHHDLVQYYKQADILVHPCRWTEPFGLVAAELVFLGKPIITTAPTGSQWIAGKGGLVAQKNSPRSVAEKICDIIENKNLRDTLSENALKRAQVLDRNNIVPLFETFLENLVQDKENVSRNIFPANLADSE